MEPTIVSSGIKMSKNYLENVLVNTGDEVNAAIDGINIDEIVKDAIENELAGGKYSYEISTNNFNNVLVTGRLDQTLSGVVSDAIETINIDTILKDDFNAGIAKCEVKADCEQSCKISNKTHVLVTQKLGQNDDVMDAVTNAIQDFDADNIVKNALTSQIDEREYPY